MGRLMRIAGISLTALISMFLLTTCHSDLLIDTIKREVEDATGPKFPQIVVRQGSTEIESQDEYPFGICEINSTESIQFSIKNEGNAPLQLTGAELVAVEPTGTTSEGIFEALQPGSPVAAGGTVNFYLEFNPDSVISFTADVTIESNDPAVPVFEFSLTGQGSSDQTGPTVLSSTPEPFEPDHPIDEDIRIVFNEDLDISSLNSSNFQVYDVTASQTVAGTRNFQPSTDEAVFTPSTNFTAGHEYRINLTTGVKDEVGNLLDQNYEWLFTVKSADSTTTSITTELSGLDEDTGTCTAYIYVLDQNGEPLENLSRFNFVIEEDSEGVWEPVDPEMISMEKRGDIEGPRTFTVVVDNTGSVQPTGLNVQKISLTNFFNDNFDGDDWANIWGIGQQAMFCDFTNDVMELQTVLSSMPYGSGMSYAFNTLSNALQNYYYTDTAGMEGVIFIFDGDNSGQQPNATAAMSRDLNIPIYPIGFQPQVNPAWVEELATAGYGYYFNSQYIYSLSYADLENVYQEILDHMDKAYVLTWPSTSGVVDLRITIDYTAENGSWSPSDNDIY